MIKSGVADQNDGILKEVRVGLVVDCGSTEGKILETSFSLALSDFYGINNEYGTITIVSVLARDPLLVFAALTNSQECKSRSYCWCTIITRMQQLEHV
ncbi:unnamed protein product [Brassica napus]|uniref:(rape) hypothetical protein n=1 Tax=Brassica napus TaxID=3708 RepID=A0A816Y7Z9_BRANA|nr:unnamed protein product [Brassica napus]CAF2370356.1 unnamed protein product [Brassica napus]